MLWSIVRARISNHLIYNIMVCVHKYLVPIIIVACGVYVNNGKEADNNIIFEKYEYRILNETITRMNHHKITLIAHNVIRTNTSVSILLPLTKIWVRTALYYKYTRYQKFLIDFNIEVCHLLKDDIFKHPLATLAFQNFIVFLGQFDFGIDFELRCPVNGTILFYAERLNISRLTLPLLPAGRYRFDVSYRTQRNGPPFADSEYYFQVSDLRVWF